MAMVTGLIPILRAAVEATTDYTGRTLWFGFAVVRLLTLYVSELPWGRLDQDFDCQGNGTSEFCRKDCFSEHFNVPVVSLWNSFYVFFVGSVLVMELFTSQLRHNLAKSAMKKRRTSPEDKTLSGTWTSEFAHKDVVLDFHQMKLMVVLYLGCIVLRLIGEMAFIYVLLWWHLPLVSGELIFCATNSCPGPFNCLVRFSAEKRMSLYLLVSLSTALATVSIAFALFIGFHYLAKKHCKKEKDMGPV